MDELETGICWAGERFTYKLTRDDGRYFCVASFQELFKKLFSCVENRHDSSIVWEVTEQTHWHIKRENFRELCTFVDIESRSHNRLLPMPPARGSSPASLRS